MITVVLLVAMTTALPGAQALTAPAAQPGPHHLHPAGCHSQESTAPAAPSPSPTSYQCCVNGHHAAIPNASFTWRPWTACLCGFDDNAGFRSNRTAYRHCATFVAPSVSPPDAAPLRI